jgi:two-component system, OmpR family, sensor kinase
VRIGVDDRGPGFPPALLSRVLDPFTRGLQPAEQQAGAGLGLAIVSAVAKAHGGSATAGNRDGGGASVEVVLAVGPEGRG